MAAEPMTNEDLRAAAELLELDSPGTWTRSERNAIIAATAAAARRLLEEVQRLKAKLAAAANTIAAPAVQLAEIGALVGYPDPPGIADAVRAELAARDASIAALSERCTAKGLELDRVIREAAADKAKLAAVRKIKAQRRNSAMVTSEQLATMHGWNDAVNAIREALEPCTCTLTDPSTWETYGGLTEPGSTYQWEPDCPAHGDAPDAAPEMPRPPAQESTVPTPSIHAQSDEQAADDSTEGATE